MSGSVNGQNGNNPIIKLHNGKTFDLRKLDSLIGKSSVGSVFASWDTATNGGNANNIFDEAEINAIKAQLIQLQSSDNAN